MADRSCLVCRKVDLKERLLRFSIYDGVVSFDLRKDTKGRGVYLHAKCCAHPKLLQNFKSRFAKLDQSIDFRFAEKEELLKLFREKLSEAVNAPGKLSLKLEARVSLVKEALAVLESQKQRKLSNNRNREAKIKLRI